MTTADETHDNHAPDFCSRCGEELLTEGQAAMGICRDCEEAVTSHDGSHDRDENGPSGSRS
jgi:predicted amidophosphoribosyltransferase